MNAPTTIGDDRLVSDDGTVLYMKSWPVQHGYWLVDKVFDHFRSEMSFGQFYTLYMVWENTSTATSASLIISTNAAFACMALTNVDTVERVS